MKNFANLFIVTALVIFFSFCQQQKSELPYIDVRKDYPEKEIFLTDIANVTYLHLKSDNVDYLYDGIIRAITENTVVILDYMRGSILFFSKDGTPKSRFNRQGNGPKEYISTTRVLYDEAADDVLVVDRGRSIIQVYSSTGVHKREITLPQGARINNDIVMFDDHSLFFCDEGEVYRRVMANNSSFEITSRLFYRVSTINGKILDSIKLPIPPIFLGMYQDGRVLMGGLKHLLVKGQEGVFLCNPETDTVFLYGKDQSLTPVLHKIPPVASEAPMTYLNNCVDVGRYQFLQAYTIQRAAPVFSAKYYMRDKKTGEICSQKLRLSDYQGKDFNIGPYEGGVSGHENGVIITLNLVELKEAYAQNQLSGKLKELVATLKDDDNDVYMMVQFK